MNTGIHEPAPVVPQYSLHFRMCIPLPTLLHKPFSRAAGGPKVEVEYVQSVFAVSYSYGWVAHSCMCSIELRTCGTLPPEQQYAKILWTYWTSTLGVILGIFY